MKVEEHVPASLAAKAAAAVDWFSRSKGAAFKITGFIESENAAPTPETTEITLILCGMIDGQDACLKETFHVTATAPQQFSVTQISAAPDFGSPLPEQDPPVGVRSEWLDQVIPNAQFVVLLFYRGLW